MYKNYKIMLGEMSFFKDFVNDTRGDLYPVAEKSDDCSECVENNLYRVSSGYAERVLCQFFPFASYDIKATELLGKMGFIFRLPSASASILASSDTLYFACGEHCEKVALPLDPAVWPWQHEDTISPRSRP